MQVKGTRMLRVKSVAEMFDVSPSTIYRLIEAGRLDALKMSAGSERGSLRIPEYAVAAFVQACAEAAYSTENARAGQGVCKAARVAEPAVRSWIESRAVPGAGSAGEVVDQGRVLGGGL